MTKVCPNCQMENANDAQFCQNCGNTLGDNSNIQTFKNDSSIETINKTNAKSSNNNKKLIIPIIAIIVIAAVIGGYFLLNNHGYTLAGNAFNIPDSAVSVNKTVISENNVETSSSIEFNTSSAEVVFGPEDDIQGSIDLEEELNFKQIDADIPITIYDYCYSDEEASEIQDSRFRQYGFVGYFKVNNQYYTISSWSKDSRADALQPIIDLYQANNQIEDIY